MKVFIPSKGRPDIISTHLLFKNTDLDYHIILHNQQEKSYYLLNKTIEPSKIIISNVPFGMTNTRRFVYDNLVDNDEWFLMLDDNITEIIGVHPDYYNEDWLPVQKDNKFEKIFEHKISGENFIKICQEMIIKGEQIGAYHMGFATNENYFFRPKKYRTVGYVIGKATITKKIPGMNWDVNVRSIDDFGYTAQQLLKFGKVLINNFVYPAKTHYQRGGIGVYKERIPERLKDCEYLMKKYPGLFKHPNKKQGIKEIELAINFRTEKQVEIWRQNHGGQKVDN